MRLAGFAVALVILGSIPASAWGGNAVPSCIAPPGTAAIEEYCEQVLSPEQGRRRPDEIPAVSRKTVSELGGAPQGRQIALAVGRLRVGRPHRAPEARGWAGPSYPGTVPGLASAVSQGSTVGGGTLTALLAVTLAMFGWWARSRRTVPADDDA